MQDDNYLIEQYKLLLSLYDTEVTRFWTRFHIFLGFQIVLAGGIMASPKILTENVFIFRLAVVAATIISFASCIIHFRGYIRQRHMINAIAMIEKKSKGTLILLSTFRLITKQSPSGNSFIATIIGACATIFWGVFVVYLEHIDYALKFS
jgi:hypothetical protein